MNRLAYVQPKKRLLSTETPDSSATDTALAELLQFYHETTFIDKSKVKDLGSDVKEQATLIGAKAVDLLNRSPIKDVGVKTLDILEKTPLMEAGAKAMDVRDSVMGKAKGLFNNSGLKAYTDKAMDAVDTSMLQELGSKVANVIADNPERVRDTNNPDTNNPAPSKFTLKGKSRKKPEPTVKKRSVEEAEKARHYVGEIVSDILQHRCSTSKQWRTTKFYAMVESGYVPLIKAVFSELDKRRNLGNKNWILGLKVGQDESQDNISQVSISPSIFQEVVVQSPSGRDNPGFMLDDERFVNADCDKVDDMKKESIIQVEQPEMIRRGRKEKVIGCMTELGDNLIRFIIFLLTFTTWIALTPFFYPLHNLVQRSLRRNIRKSMSVPEHVMTLVVRSNSFEMMTLFKDQGVRIEELDANRNNVFHHVAYFSRWEPQKAVEYLELLVQVYPEADICGMLFEENNDGFTPLDCAAEYGSLLFLQYLFHHDRCLATLAEHLSSNQFIINGVELHFEEEITTRYCKETPLFELATLNYDLTRFENGDVLGKQSSILNVLSKRSFSELMEEEMKVIVHDELLKRWIARKIRSNQVMSSLTFFLNVVFTGVIVFYLVVLVSQNEFTPLTFNFGNILAQIIKDVNYNRTGILPDESLPLRKLNEVCMDIPMSSTGANVSNWCVQEALLQIQELCPHSPLEDYLVMTGLVEGDGADTKAMSGFILCGFAGVNILVDFLIRAVFLWKNIFGNGASGRFRISVGWKRAFFREIPGCYLAKHLTIFTSALCFVFPLINIFVHDTWTVFSDLNVDRSLTDMTNDAIYIEYFSKGFLGLMFVCLLMRVVSFIYALRLYANLTHLILAVLRVTVIVIGYILTYVVLIAAFNLLSFSFTYTTPCKVHGLSDVSQIFKAMYDTILFSLTFKGDVFLAGNYDGVDVVVVAFYVLFTIVIVINLLASIVRVSIEETSQRDKTEAACISEKLGDALSAEALTQLLFLPCSAFFHRAVLSRSGFITQDCRRCYKERHLPNYNVMLKFRKEIDSIEATG